MATKLLTGETLEGGELLDSGLEQRIREFWDDWYGNKRFHQAPLYPYLIGLIFFVFGAKLSVLYLLQLLLGIGSVVLVYFITKKLLDESQALIAALLVAMSGTLLIYEMVLLRTSLIIFFNCLLVFTIVNRQGQGIRYWFAFGALSALAYILKPTFIVYSAIGLLLAKKKTFFAFSFSFLVVLSPVVLRNYLVSTPLLSVSSVGPITLLASNTSDYSADIGWSVSLETVPEVLKNSDGSMLSTVGALIEHLSLPDYLRIYGGKIAATFRWLEVPNNINYYYYKLHTPVLNYLPFNFSSLICFAILGMGLLAPRVKKLWPIYLLFIVNFAPLVALYPVSRFRVTLMPALAIFSSACVFELWRLYSLRRRESLLLCICLLSLGGILVHRPLSEDRVIIRPADYWNPFRYYFHPRILEAREEGDEKKAVREFETFLEKVPQVVGELSPARSSQEAAVARFYSSVFSDYRVSLENLGLVEEVSLIDQKAKKLALIGQDDFDSALPKN